MKIACGTDIIEIDRIKKSIEGKEKKFISSIFTEKEIKYCETKKNKKYQHYAARFAAKEAIFKALSTKLEKPKIGFLTGNVTWRDFEILNDKNGRPVVTLNCEIPELEEIDVSMSHCEQFAIANVIVIYKD